VVVVAPVVAATSATSALVASGSTRRLGATVEEAALGLPGDELLGRADVQADRAITIAAPPERVWPWVAQLGQAKGGFYSFAWLENLAGCEVRNAEEIVPAWQDPRVGDPFPLHPDLVLTLGRVDPGRALVATSQSGAGDPRRPASGMDFTWAFVVRAVSGVSDADPATRLHVRERYRVSGRGPRVGVEVMNLVSSGPRLRARMGMGEDSALVCGWVPGGGLGCSSRNPPFALWCL